MSRLHLAEALWHHGADMAVELHAISSAARAAAFLAHEVVTEAGATPAAVSASAAALAAVEAAVAHAAAALERAQAAYAAIRTTDHHKPSTPPCADAVPGKTEN